MFPAHSVATLSARLWPDDVAVQCLAQSNYNNNQFSKKP